jgi:hypothetical protein
LLQPVTNAQRAAAITHQQLPQILLIGGQGHLSARQLLCLFLCLLCQVLGHWRGLRSQLGHGRCGTSLLLRLLLWRVPLLQPFVQVLVYEVAPTLPAAVCPGLVIITIICVYALVPGGMELLCWLQGLLLRQHVALLLGVTLA